MGRGRGGSCCTHPLAAAEGGSTRAECSKSGAGGSEGLCEWGCCTSACGWEPAAVADPCEGGVGVGLKTGGG